MASKRSKGGKKRKVSDKSIIAEAAKRGKVQKTTEPSGAVTYSTTKTGPKRILVWGASPYVITGFGVVMRKILQGLYKQYPGEYEIYQVGINHMGDHYEELELTGGFENGRYRQWPAMMPGMNSRIHLYGQRKFLELMPKLVPNIDFDFVFLFEDPFWVGGGVPNLNPPMAFIDAIKKQLTGLGKPYLPLVAYFPIDGVPKKGWIENIAKVDFPITYLKFGAAECIKRCPDLNGRLGIIPHGVDTQEFYPVDPQQARTFKRAMFGDYFTNKFMFLNVNRNQLRKMLPSTLLAFREFQKRTQGAGFLYMNMKAQDVGWNLPEVCSSLGLQIGKDVLFPPSFNVQKGLTLEDLNMAFNAADALVTSAIGGGWELAITQAFATKTLVIAPANTSHLELCGSGEDCRGVLYKSGSNLSQIGIFPNDNEVPRPMPDTDDLLDKMLWAYENPEECKAIQERAYTWVTSSYQWDKDVVPKFHEVFCKAAQLKKMHMSLMQPQQVAQQQSNITVNETPVPTTSEADKAGDSAQVDEQK
jgi:glycosyltransferase involved in cell wall biosynthesis